MWRQLICYFQHKKPPILKRGPPFRGGPKSPNGGDMEMVAVDLDMVPEEDSNKVW